MESTLIFVTTSYPYGNGETFIESEINYLSEAFERIYLITTSSDKVKTREAPQNVRILRYVEKDNPLNNLDSLKYLFSEEVKEEKKVVKNTYHQIFNFFLLKICLRSLSNANQFYLFLEELIQTENISKNRLYIYSYWMDDRAIGLALLKQANPGIKAFCRTHRWDLYFEGNYQGYLPFRKLLYDRLDGIFSISENGKRYLEHKLQLKNSPKIKVSRLGTINNFKPDFKVDNNLLLFSCSNMIPRKRIDLIIKSLAQIDDFNLKWFHAGSGELENNLKILADNLLRAKQNVQYSFLGAISNPEVHQIYRENNVALFLNVSESEGIPVSIMEAMSYGVPVVAKETGGVNELVPGNGGFLLDHDADEYAIAATIKKFFGLTEAHKAAYRKKAYQQWNDYFNAEKNYPDFVQAIFLLSAVA